MTLSISIVQDADYPMIGDALTLSAVDVPAGQRVRYRLKSVPPQSALPIWEDSTLPEQWLATSNSNSAKLAGDQVGEYVVTVVVETYVGHIPHYDGDGSTSAHPIEEWTVSESEDLSVYFGCVMDKQLGLAPHTATLRAYVHASAAATQGVLTWWVDRNRCPRVINPSSDIAACAAEGAEVLIELARIGGPSYTGTADLINVGGAPGGFIYSPSSIAYLLAAAFNVHRGLTTNGVHDTTDEDNPMSGYNEPETSSEFVTFANAFRTLFNLHLGCGATVHPNGADTTNLVTTPSASSYTQAVYLLNDIRTKYAAHRVLHTAHAHATPGDGRAVARATPYALVSTAFNSVAGAYAKALADAYDAHLACNTAIESYHSTADTVNTVDEVTASSLAELIPFANDIAAKLHAHAMNQNSATGETVGIHTRRDYSCDLSLVPRANDWPSVVTLIDKCAQVYLQHVDTSGTWHGGTIANPGIAFVQLYGANLIHKLFLDATVSATLGAPANVLTAFASMVTMGGFKKAVT